MEDITLRTVEAVSSQSNNTFRSLDITISPGCENSAQDTAAAGGLAGVKVFSACLCCYTAIDFEDPVLCKRQKSSGICIDTESCLDPSADSLGVGCIKDESMDEICRLGAYCCACSLKRPQLSCTSVQQTLCVRSVKSLPFNRSYVSEPTCACCFLQCLPNFGCMMESTDCRALESLTNVGGGDLTTHSVAKKIVRSHAMER